MTNYTDNVTSLLKATTKEIINSNDLDYDTIKIIDRYVTIVISLIGIPGNILCMAVFMQKDMQNSSGFYLMILSINNSFFICLFLFANLRRDLGVDMTRFSVLCEMYKTVFLFIHILSPFLVLAFTVERYISIFHPLKRIFYCTVKRAKIVVAGLYVFTLAISSPQAYFKLHQCYNVSNGEGDGSTGDAIRSAARVYMAIIDLLCFILVNAIILVLNVLLFIEIKRKMSIKRTHIQTGHGESAILSSRSPCKPNPKGITAMLLGVSCYQIITAIPAYIANNYDFYYFYYGHGTDKDIERLNNFYLFRTIAMDFQKSYYSFNCIIFVITGKKFREALKRLISDSLCAKLYRWLYNITFEDTD